MVNPPPTPAQQADLADDDNDGVINARDLCQNTPKGKVINNDGCTISATTHDIDSFQIQFNKNSSVIPASYETPLNKLAVFLKKNPQIQFEIQGNINQNLNESQLEQNHNGNLVNSIQKHLIDKGVPAQQLSIIMPAKNNLKLSHVHFINNRVVGRVKDFNGKMLDKWSIFTHRNE